MAEVNKKFWCTVCGDIWITYIEADGCCKKIIECYQCDYCEEVFGGLTKNHHLINGKCPKELEATNDNALP